MFNFFELNFLSYLRTCSKKTDPTAHLHDIIGKSKNGRSDVRCIIKDGWLGIFGKLLLFLLFVMKLYLIYIYRI